MRISDWSSDVCSSDLLFCKIAKGEIPSKKAYEDEEFFAFHDINPAAPVHLLLIPKRHVVSMQDIGPQDAQWLGRMMALAPRLAHDNGCTPGRSEEHTSELQSLMRISYAVFCLKKKNTN